MNKSWFDCQTEDKKDKKLEHALATATSYTVAEHSNSPKSADELPKSAGELQISL